MIDLFSLASVQYWSCFQCMYDETILLGCDITMVIMCSMCMICCHDWPFSLASIHMYVQCVYVMDVAFFAWPGPD